MRRLSVALSVLLMFAGARAATAQQSAYVTEIIPDSSCTSCARGLVSVVNTATNQVERSIEVWNGLVTTTGPVFGDVLVHPSGTRLYVIVVQPGSFHPLLRASTRIHVFDTRTQARLTDFDGEGASSCVFSADGTRLFCLRNIGRATVGVVDVATNTTITEFQAGTFSVARQASITIGSSLRMVIDAPAAGASVSGSFAVAGWALDSAAPTGTGIDAIHVWAYPASGAAPVFAGAATLGVSRPDVAAIFGSQFGSAGYTLSIDSMAAGSYTLVVYAHQASTGTFAANAVVNVSVTAPQPQIVIDLPAANATLPSSVRVAGWAIELGAAVGTGVDAVHVWAYPASGAAPVLVGVAAYGISRPDVGALFGSRYTPSGFDVNGSLPAGTYTIVAFAHSTTTGTFNGVRTVRVTVQ